MKTQSLFTLNVFYKTARFCLAMCQCPFFINTMLTVETKKRAVLIKLAKNR